MVSVVFEVEWKSITEWGIVMAVIRSDAQNGERINILWLPGSLVFFQNSRGARMRETSAMTSVINCKSATDMVFWHLKAHVPSFDTSTTAHIHAKDTVMR